jgi:hypothetical protein
MKSTLTNIFLALACVISASIILAIAHECYTVVKYNERELMLKKELCSQYFFNAKKECTEKDMAKFELYYEVIKNMLK